MYEWMSIHGFVDNPRERWMSDLWNSGRFERRMYEWMLIHGFVDDLREGWMSDSWISG